MDKRLFERMSSGPIPGENMTSDTRNYPWHRPPQFTDLDEAFEDILSGMQERRSVASLIAAASIGINLMTLARTNLLASVMEGKITPDFAVMLAGPTVRMMEIILKEAGVEYDLGLGDELEGIPSPSYLRRFALGEEPADEAIDEGVEAAAEIASAPGGSFLDMPVPDAEEDIDEEEALS